MTDKQWEALKKMTSSSMFKGTTWWACDLEIGRVKINRVDVDYECYYELEYPSYSVNLYKDVLPTTKDLVYLRVLYKKWSEYMKRRDI